MNLSYDPFKKNLRNARHGGWSTIILCSCSVMEHVQSKATKRIANALSERTADHRRVTFMVFILAVLIGYLIALAGFSRHRILREFARFTVEVIPRCSRSCAAVLHRLCRAPEMG